MNEKCGEITVAFRKNGNWEDLADILLTNGYSLSISAVKDDLPFGKSEVSEVNITIYKERQNKRSNDY